MQAWLFEAEVDKPSLQRALQVETKVGVHTPCTFEFQNPMADFVTLEIVSSRPSLLEVRREKLSFEAQERKSIELYIAPQKRA